MGSNGTQDRQDVKAENKGFLIVWMLEQEKNMRHKTGKRSPALFYFHQGGFFGGRKDGGPQWPPMSQRL